MYHFSLSKLQKYDDKALKFLCEGVWPVQAAHLPGLRQRSVRRVGLQVRHQGGQLHRVCQEEVARADQGEDTLRHGVQDGTSRRSNPVHEGRTLHLTRQNLNQ